LFDYRCGHDLRIEATVGGYKSAVAPGIDQEYYIAPSKHPSQYDFSKLEFMVLCNMIDG
jgi:hypothetical protein